MNTAYVAEQERIKASNQQIRDEVKQAIPLVKSKWSCYEESESGIRINFQTKRSGYTWTRGVQPYVAIALSTTVDYPATRRRVNLTGDWKAKLLEKHAELAAINARQKEARDNRHQEMEERDKAQAEREERFKKYIGAYESRALGGVKELHYSLNKLSPEEAAELHLLVLEFIHQRSN